MGRIIGLDMGERRIGVAVSDETETIATALETIEIKEPDDAIAKVKAIADRYSALKIIVGLPLRMDGSIGDAAEKVGDFVGRLKKRLSAEVLTFDERLTTRQGEALLLQADMSRAKRKRTIDRVAAGIMLQAYLDSLKEGE